MQWLDKSKGQLYTTHDKANPLAHLLSFTCPIINANILIKKKVNLASNSFLDIHWKGLNKFMENWQAGKREREREKEREIERVKERSVHDQFINR